MASGTPCQDLPSLLHGCQGYKRIKVAVDHDHVSPSLGHPDGALLRGHPVHVPLWPYSHAGGHGFPPGQSDLSGPLHLLNVFEVLAQKKSTPVSLNTLSCFLNSAWTSTLVFPPSEGPSLVSNLAGMGVGGGNILKTKRLIQSRTKQFSLSLATLS